MTVTVSPAEFRFVSFDADQIQRIAEGIAAALGMAGTAIDIVVDETTPLARIRAVIDGPAHLRIEAESGAFEDTRQPRNLSETATANSLGRVLLRARDRLEGGFGEAPTDDDLSLAQTAAWDTYCMGRVDRLGVPVNQQRWRYNFRNRHGFSDHTDGVFDQVWSSDGLTWAELDELSRTATAISG